MSQPGGEIGNEKPGFHSGAVPVLMISSILAAGAALAVMRIFFGKVIIPAFLAGYGLALVNAAVGLVINVAAMQKAGSGFVTAGAGGNVLRATAILIIILLIKVLKVVDFIPFTAVFMSAYFIFLFAEIIRMNRLCMKG